MCTSGFSFKCILRVLAEVEVLSTKPLWSGWAVRSQRRLFPLSLFQGAATVHQQVSPLSSLPFPFRLRDDCGGGHSDAATATATRCPPLAAAVRCRRCALGSCADGWRACAGCTDGWMSQSWRLHRRSSPLAPTPSLLHAPTVGSSPHCAPLRSSPALFFSFLFSFFFVSCFFKRTLDALSRRCFGNESKE